MKNVTAIVLAGGKGTRMGGDLPKVLYELNGQPVIYWPLKTLENIHIEDVKVVVGYKADLIKESLHNLRMNPEFVIQEYILGTAHAVSLALNNISDQTTTVLVLFGDDSALYKEKTLISFIEYHQKINSKATFLTTTENGPDDLGGLIVSGGIVGKIVLKDQLTQDTLPLFKVLCGAFCFDVEWLRNSIQLIEPSEKSGEYGLPRIIDVARDQKVEIYDYELKNHYEWNSINTLEQLKQAEEKMIA